MRAVSIAGLAVLALVAAAVGAQAKTLRFSGHDFIVRPAGVGGPGPNSWSPRNAWVDEQGRLHLKLSRRGGKWYAAEVYTKQRLGFGRYEFRIETNLDRLDRNAVLGLFHYPTADVGADATNEIDIEFARWGKRKGPVGNYTVWPVDEGLDYTTRRPPESRASRCRCTSISGAIAAIRPRTARTSRSSFHRSGLRRNDSASHARAGCPGYDQAPRQLHG